MKMVSVFWQLCVCKMRFSDIFLCFLLELSYLRSMITIGEMQISGTLTMLMLSVMMILCVPRHSRHSGSFAKARWIMAAGTGLISLQFLLQYIIGFRQMGITQGVLLNLLLFMPASMLCCMAILYVQLQGHVARKNWIVGGGICSLSALILISTVLLDGIPLQQESKVLRMTEYIGAVLYVVMQTYVFVLQLKAYRTLSQAVEEYYDSERRDLFNWMGLSMKAMTLLAFLVPLIIFMDGKPLVLFSLAYFLCISYSAISFYSYGISENMMYVEEAESKNVNDILNANENCDIDGDNDSNNITKLDQQRQRVEEALKQWTDSGAYREHNLTIAVVARQMGLPQKQLQEWLRQSEYKKLAGLVTTLRIEEAKRVLKEHPDWSVESVADHCGFNDRKYFHQVFLQYTGTTPAKFQQEE